MAKIGFLSENFYFYNGVDFQSGGGESYQFSLCQFLIEQGHDLEIYQFSYEPFVNKYKNKQGSLTIRGLGNVTKINGNYKEDSEKGVEIFIEKTKKCDFYIFLTVNLAYKKMPKPTIGIFHGIYWNFDNEAYRQPMWNDMVKKWVRNLDVVVSVDTDCINFIRANMPKFIEKCNYIPNWCDIDLFIPKERQQDGLFKVIYARRLNELRGVHLFLKSAETLTEKYPDIFFTVCGKGLGDSMKRVGEWADKHKNCEYKFHDISEMQDEYPLHDLSVVPSVASEGLSLSLLESFSCGLPVVGTDVGGIPNALINKFNGIMIRANQQEELTNAIEYAYLHREEVNNWSKNAIAVAQTFNKKRWKEQWLEIINKNTNAWGVND